MSITGLAEPLVVVTALDRESASPNYAKSQTPRQREKIRQIGKALRQAGFVTLDDKAKALGLCRSTTWKLLQGDHKSSGLHAGLIGRMLAHKILPPAVRSVLREYVIEKARGLYGHNMHCRRLFAAYFCDIPELAEFLIRSRLEVIERTARSAAADRHSDALTKTSTSSSADPTSRLLIFSSGIAQRQTPGGNNERPGTRRPGSSAPLENKGDRPP
jgi:hypothetical protein